MSSFNTTELEKNTKILTELTTDIEMVEKLIDDIPEPYGESNYEEAFSRANDILHYSSMMITAMDNDENNNSENKPMPKPMPKPYGPTLIDNVILFSDGLPTTSSGKIMENYVPDFISRYTGFLLDIPYFKNAYNAVYEIEELKRYKDNIYTIGFLQNANNSEKQYSNIIMKAISSNSYNYTVEDIEKLEFIFGEDLDPIIIIPGIMGSRLYLNENFNEDNRVWEPAISTIKGLRKNILRDLIVRGIENQHYTEEKEYGAKNAYKKLVDELCTRFPNRAIYVYSYDWRNSNSESAEKLNTAINKILEETGKKKVDIVAHSMGGLVTSSYYSKYGNNKLDKVITCGTPYEGAAKMFNAVLNWDVIGDRAIPETWEVTEDSDWLDFWLAWYGMTRELKSKFRGVAELVPT